MENQGRLLTTKEVAELHKCTLRNVQLAIAHGRLLAFKIGRDWLVDYQEAIRWHITAKRGRPVKMGN